MPSLTTALDPDAMGPLLRRSLAAERSEWSAAELIGVRLIRHKAGRRALIEYALSGKGASGGGIEQLTVLGKLRAKGLDRRTPVVMAELRRAGFGGSSADGVSIPEVVGAVPELGLWLQQAVSGCSLAEWPAAHAGVFLAGRVAEALHKLHRTPVSTTRQHTVEDELGILAERFSRLIVARPDWSGRLRRLQEACVDRARSLSGRKSCGIHRDFYPAQILAQGDRLWLLDFDLYCEGDPALDVGNFLGHLTEQAIRVHRRAHALADSERAFVGRYQELSAERSTDAIEAWQTLTLARHVSISFAFPERREFTEALLAHCEKRLGCASSVPLAISACARGGGA